MISSLKNTGTVSYSQMSEDLLVSEDTIRKDIDYLHENGLYQKSEERYHRIRIRFHFKTVLIFNLEKNNRLEGSAFTKGRNDCVYGWWNHGRSCGMFTS
ncbi:hypothetical protein CS542_05595 [Pedobacter sp. IW39]|nr:hypothetical protein CS542_05595 [Pedobacter sp. IW39]